MFLPLLAVLVVSVCYVEASPTLERDTEEKLLNLLARVLDDQNGKSTMKKDQLVEKAENGMEKILEERQQVTYELRLAGGNDRYEGRVEVGRAGSWGTVCDDGWGQAEAAVVCRQLGFSGGTAFTNAAFGQGTGDIVLDDVVCTGAETNIASCSSRGWGINNCQHYEDAGVRCQGSAVGSADGDLRLAGGEGNSGRVEVFYSGEWGTVCDDNWADAANARVVCRQLGLPYSGARAETTNAYYGQGSGRIWLDDVSCTGSEGRLDQCGRRNNQWGSNNCGHNEDVVVFCE